MRSARRRTRRTGAPLTRRDPSRVPSHQPMGAGHGVADDAPAPSIRFWRTKIGVKSGRQSTVAGAFALVQNLPSARTKGLGGRAGVRIDACVIYNPDWAPQGSRKARSGFLAKFSNSIVPRRRSFLCARLPKPHQTLHSPIFYHTEPAPQRKFPAIRPARG